MNILPLEVIEYIAKLDNEVWYKLVQVYKFLSEKTLIEDMKRKFLLCSISYPDMVRNESITYKYNKKFHKYGKNNEQCYVLVYYLPNGDLHTFEDPCRTGCLHNGSYLEVWIKDNKIHRDDDNPSVICKQHDLSSMSLKYSRIYDFPLFYHLYKYLDNGKYLISEHTKMWFKNNEFYRDNDLPVIVKEEYKEWRKNNLIHRDNDLPAVTIISTEGRGQAWYQNGKTHRENNLPAVITLDGTQVFYENGVPIYGIMPNGHKYYY